MQMVLHRQQIVDRRAKFDSLSPRRELTCVCEHIEEVGAGREGTPTLTCEGPSTSGYVFVSL